MEHRSRAQVRLAVSGVLLGTVLQAVDGSIVNVAIPQIQLQMKAPLGLVGWAVTGYVLASLLAMPLAASLAARVGLRRYFAGSVAIFTLASVACGLSRGAGWLIAFRALQGLGAGGLLPLSQGILMSLFPGPRRGTAVALVGFAAVLGPLLGPPIGGALTDLFGWPAIFWINVPLGLISIVLLLGYLQDGPRPALADEPLDLRGAGLLCAAVVCLQIACAHHPWLILPAALFAFLFVRHERAVPAPAVDLSVLRHRALRGTLLAAPLYGVGLYASVFLTPLLLEQQLGLGAGATGLVVAVGGLSSGALIVSARPLLERLRPRTLSLIGSLLFAVSMLLLARVAIAGHGLLAAVLAQGLRGAGTGLLYVGMNGFAFESVPQGELATSASLFYLMRQLGGSLGVALSASALDRLGPAGAAPAFALLALTAPLAMLPMAGRATAPPRPPRTGEIPLGSKVAEAVAQEPELV